MLHVLYLVHDLVRPGGAPARDDASGRRRKVTLAGFRGAKDVAPGSRSLSPIDLGTTGTAISRSASSLSPGPRCRSAPSLPGRAEARPHHRPQSRDAGACQAAPTRCLRGDVPVVYECLDIHRLLLGDNGIGRAMRARRAAARPRRRSADDQLAGLRAGVFPAASGQFRRAGRAAAEQGPGNRRRPAARHCSWRLRRRPASPGRSAGSARCAAASRSSCLPPSRAGWTAASRWCCAAARPIPSSPTSTASSPAEPHMRFRRCLPQSRGSGRDLRRGAFHLGDRLLRGRPEFQLAAAQPALRGLPLRRCSDRHEADRDRPLPRRPRHLGLLLDEASPEALAAVARRHDDGSLRRQARRRSWRRTAEPGSATAATAARWSIGCKALAGAAPPGRRCCRLPRDDDDADRRRRHSLRRPALHGGRFPASNEASHIGRLLDAAGAVGRSPRHEDRRRRRRQHRRNARDRREHRRRQSARGAARQREEDPERGDQPGGREVRRRISTASSASMRMATIRPTIATG